MKAASKSFLFGIGHAMCDVSVRLDDEGWAAFEKVFGFAAGGRPYHIDIKVALKALVFIEKLVEAGRADLVYSAGGSALNAVRAASMLGARTSFSGCIGADAFGGIIVNDIEASGVRSLVERREGEHSGIFCVVRHRSRSKDSKPEAPPIIFASPAVARKVREMPLASLVPEGSGIVHAEGLLSDREGLLEKVFQSAKAKGLDVSIDLVSAEMASRYRVLNISLIERFVDYVFCTRAEFEALGADVARMRPDIAWIVKADKEGVDCCFQDESVHEEAPAGLVADDLGAGDAFAGAFLYGRILGWPLKACMKLGSAAAACALRTKGSVPDAACMSSLREAILADKGIFSLH